MIGVYWGAFDPPTDAHRAVITMSLRKLALKKLLVIVNNHQYKNYTFPLADRVKLLTSSLDHSDLKKVEILTQDDHHKIDYKALKQLAEGPLCAIAGYDSYKNWIHYSSSEERSAYDAIAVIPRGNEPPILHDKNAFLLHIEEIYKDTSSTQVRGYCSLKDKKASEAKHKKGS